VPNLGIQIQFFEKIKKAGIFSYVKSYKKGRIAPSTIPGILETSLAAIFTLT
jgi:hypothetical protein